MKKNILLIFSLLLSINLFIYSMDDGGVSESKDSDAADHAFGADEGVVGSPEQAFAEFSAGPFFILHFKQPKHLGDFGSFQRMPRFLLSYISQFLSPGGKEVLACTCQRMSNFFDYSEIIKFRDMPKHVRNYIFHKALENGQLRFARRLMECGVDTDNATPQEIITNLTIRSKRIILPEMITNLTDFDEKNEVVIHAKKGRLIINKF